MEQLLNWIEINRNLVYLLLFAYCALKSGALPLLAGILAQAGALDISPILLAAFLGGYLGDELRFSIARRWGPKLFLHRPYWRARLDKAVNLVERYGTAYMFLYRYPKGMRTIGALPVGLSDIPWLKFTALNATSAAVWSAALVGTGILLGDSIAVAAENWWGVGSVVLLVIFLISAWFAFRQLEQTSTAR